MKKAIVAVVIVIVLFIALAIPAEAGPKRYYTVRGAELAPET